MDKLNQSARNIELLIDNTPLTKTQREELIEGLKYLYDIASKHFIKEEKTTSVNELKLPEIKESKMPEM